jgi:hypothetical protein
MDDMIRETEQHFNESLGRSAFSFADIDENHLLYRVLLKVVQIF